MYSSGFQKYMLDTNTASYIIRDNSFGIERLDNIPGYNVCISSIVAAELLLGIAKNPEARRLRVLVDDFISKTEILPWDFLVADDYAEFRALCEFQGKSLGIMDMLIAAHAKSVDAILVTSDKAFYQFEGYLKLEDWRKTQSLH